MLLTMFTPAMYLMSRLRFVIKIGVIGVLFLLPLTGIAYFFYSKITKDIEFAGNERLGVRQIVSTGHFMQTMQQHRRASQLMLSGDKSARDRLPGLTAKASENIEALGKIVRSATGPAKTADEFAAIENAWAYIKNNGDKLEAPENLDRHNGLISEIINFVHLTNDRFDLSVDPDLDSLYTLDAFSIYLPDALNYLGQLRGKSYEALLKKSITAGERIEINILQNSFARELGKLKLSLNKAIQANPSLGAVMEAKSKNAFDAAGYFSGSQTAGLMKGELTLAPAELFDHGTVAIAALYELFDLSADELDSLLAQRIHRLQASRNSILAGTGFVLVLVLYLFSGMLLSVLRSLRAISEGAERLARGDVSQRVDSHSSDELSDVGRAVNSVIRTLEKFVKAQLEMAEAHNRDGCVSHEIRAGEFAGAYGEMARNVNEMVKGHIGVQTDFAGLMMQYANGEFANQMAPLPGERREISDAAGKVRAGLEAASLAARYNARVKAALDHVNIPVRIASDDGEILYINNALNDAFHKHEAAFRRQIPGFDADKAAGGNIGMFYEDGDAAIAQLRRLTSTAVSRLVLGGRQYDVVTTPVLSEQGERLGTVGQWTDMTEQLAAEQEVASIVEAAAAGNFALRIVEAGKDGFMLQMSQGLNAIIAVSETALHEIARLLKALAQGDLTQNIETGFQGVFAELKDNSNSTSKRLREIIQQIRDASGAIDSAASEIAAGNDDLSRRTEEQASSLEETASSIEELAATVKLNAANALQANELALFASKSAARGGEAMAQVIETMNGIEESNQEITNIITLIDGIAFQTNILALNAAVEAARAGEQGRSFAVVASEVRNLARRSADAAKDIKALIAKSAAKAGEGAKLVASAGKTIGETVSSVQRVTAIVGEIAAASKEQSDGIQQVNIAISQLDRLTQQNAALVEQSAAAAKSMEEQAQGLVGSVSIFKVTLETGNGNKRGLSDNAGQRPGSPQAPRAASRPARYASANDQCDIGSQLTYQVFCA